MIVEKMHYQLLQFLIKRKRPNFEFETDKQWCEAWCCLLCNKDLKLVGIVKATNHMFQHLKEAKLIAFL